MTYLLHRIKESNGFVAKRAFRGALRIATAAYGICIFNSCGIRRIVTPVMLYRGVPEMAEHLLSEEEDG